MSQSFGSFAKQHVKKEAGAFGKEFMRQIFGPLNTKPKCKCACHGKPKKHFKPNYHKNRKKGWW